MKVFAYVYPGWHPIPERDASFHPGFTEWELVLDCRPRFADQAQPRLPALGPYDDRDPAAVGKRIELACEHGVDGFVYGFFWCRGKRVFQEALDEGFLGMPPEARKPFALMWANRMPRRVLPVRRTDLPVIDPERRVSSDVQDFVELMSYVAQRYFKLENYIRIDGKAYFSIFDTTFFLKELGPENARLAIQAAREWLRENGYGELHLAAIDPSAEVIGSLAAVGFDSVTHYVFLPRWKGPVLQDYRECAEQRAREWPSFAERSGLPYMPSVSPGWDATPRGADFGPRRPDRYPWAPVVTGEHPEHFQHLLEDALHYASQGRVAEAIVFVASLNEWSEGHYLEPDERYQNGWLEAVQAAKLRAPAHLKD